MIEIFIKNLTELSSHTTTIFALFAVVLFIFAFLHFRKVTLNTKMIVTISLMLALTILLNQFKLYHMPQGGSITLGGMLPLLFISFRYGPGVGFLAGFLYGMINLLQDPFISMTLLSSKANNLLNILSIQVTQSKKVLIYLSWVQFTPILKIR